jgi:exo-1,4-beta-D-glucosaminidase
MFKKSNIGKVLIIIIVIMAVIAAGTMATNQINVSAGKPATNTPVPPPTNTPTSGPTPTPGPTSTPAGAAPNVAVTEIKNGWGLKSANSVTDPGSTVSTVGYNMSSWYPITLPSTVLGGLIANGVYNNVYFGTNYDSVPDLTGQNWWFRGEFTAPASVPGQQYWLHFKGVTYKAEIWLNGTQLDAAAEGAMAVHDYNVTNVINAGGANALALKVTPPNKTGSNLSFWYVDWNPVPKDMNAGIWNKVLLETTGPVALWDPYVQTTLPLPATSPAALTVYVDAQNGGSLPVTGMLKGEITKAGYPTITFQKQVTLAAGQRTEVSFTPADFAQLNVSNPALWWPFSMGAQERYDLHIWYEVGGQTWATKTIKFGIRQVTDYTISAYNEPVTKGFKINGQYFLVRGADYVWDMHITDITNTKINEAHMRYVKDMGLNTIRFEGILGNEEIYDIADREGIMLLPGFVCCSRWQETNSWSTTEVAVGAASLESQMRIMRFRPSTLVFSYGSDAPPVASVLAQWQTITANLHWQNPIFVNVASYAYANAGAKMDGPYQWEPPVYWYADTDSGGAFGFCAEQGGESVPPEESIRKFIPEADLWPIGSVYGYHAGARPFNNLDWYSTAVNNRYATSTGITQYADKAQMLNYESERAQFEAFGANAYPSGGFATGTIYWMLNNGWPSVHWNLYDYSFQQGGGYFGTKKAMEPVHILYDYNTGTIKIVNSTLTSYTGMTAKATVYNLPDLTNKYTNQVTIDVPADATTTSFTIPTISGLSVTYLIRLELKNSSGQTISNNVYWYSTTKDVLGSRSTWYNHSVSTYANMTGLNSLTANNSVTASAVKSSAGGEDTVTITVNNTSGSNIAFFTRLTITKGSGGGEVLPITYTDNYITLWPGESATIVAKYATADLGGQAPYVKVRGYNVPEFSIAVP